VSEFDREALTMRVSWPNRGYCVIENNYTQCSAQGVPNFTVLLCESFSVNINKRATINRYVAVGTSAEPLSENFSVITFFDTVQIERKLYVI